LIRQKIPGLSAWTLNELGAKMKCDRCGKRPERYYPARQSNAQGFARRFEEADVAPGRDAGEDDAAEVRLRVVVT
jgi:hypothetical protein